MTDVFFHFYLTELQLEICFDYPCDNIPMIGDNIDLLCIVQLLDNMVDGRFYEVFQENISILYSNDYGKLNKYLLNITESKIIYFDVRHRVWSYDTYYLHCYAYEEYDELT